MAQDDQLSHEECRRLHPFKSHELKQQQNEFPQPWPKDARKHLLQYPGVKQVAQLNTFTDEELKILKNRGISSVEDLMVRHYEVIAAHGKDKELKQKIARLIWLQNGQDNAQPFDRFGLNSGMKFLYDEAKELKRKHDGVSLAPANDSITKKFEKYLELKAEQKCDAIKEENNNSKKVSTRIGSSSDEESNKPNKSMQVKIEANSKKSDNDDTRRKVKSETDYPDKSMQDNNKKERNIDFENEIESSMNSNSKDERITAFKKNRKAFYQDYFKGTNVEYIDEIDGDSIVLTLTRQECLLLHEKHDLWPVHIGQYGYDGIPDARFQSKRNLAQQSQMNELKNLKATNASAYNMLVSTIGILETKSNQADWQSSSQSSSQSRAPLTEAETLGQGIGYYVALCVRLYHNKPIFVYIQQMDGDGTRDGFIYFSKDTKKIKPCVVDSGDMKIILDTIGKYGYLSDSAIGDICKESIDISDIGVPPYQGIMRNEKQALSSSVIDWGNMGQMTRDEKLARYFGALNEFGE